MPGMYALWHLRAGHGGGIPALSWQCHGAFRGHLGGVSFSPTSDPGTKHFECEIAAPAGCLFAVHLRSWEEEMSWDEPEVGFGLIHKATTIKCFLQVCGLVGSSSGWGQLDRSLLGSVPCLSSAEGLPGGLLTQPGSLSRWQLAGYQRG